MPIMPTSPITTSPITQNLKVMTPSLTTLRRSAFALHRLVRSHAALGTLSGTALVLALEDLATRESHTLALALLTFLSSRPDALAVAAADLPEHLLLASLGEQVTAKPEKPSVTAKPENAPVGPTAPLDGQKENEKEKAALSLPLNPTHFPKKKNKEKEKTAAAVPAGAPTHTREASGQSSSEEKEPAPAAEAQIAPEPSAETQETSEPSAEAQVASEPSAEAQEASEPSAVAQVASEPSAEAQEASELQAERTAPQRAAPKSSRPFGYANWTAEEFMRVARNCRGSEMSDETFRDFCLYWTQPNPRGTLAFQDQKRFSMLHRMNAWMHHELRRRKEDDERRTRIYGPAPEAPAPPELNDVLRYAALHALDEEEARRFHEYHTAYGWTAGRRPIASWQAALRLWCNNAANPNSKNHDKNTDPTPPHRRPSAPPADPTSAFQQRVDDIFNEAIRRTQGNNPAADNAAEPGSDSENNRASENPNPSDLNNHDNPDNPDNPGSNHRPSDNSK